MKKSQVRILLAILAAATVFILFYYFDVASFLTLQSLKSNQARIQNTFFEYPSIVALSYFMIYVFVTALSLPGAAILTLAGGAVFGVLFGTMLVSFASTLGATIAFLISRYVLRDWVQKRFSKNLKTVNNGFNKDGALYLLILRLIPAIPFFVINFLMGMTPMRTVTYMWVSQLGMLPATVVFVNAGTQLGQIQSLGDILTPKVMLSLAALGLLPIATKFLVSLTLSRRLKSRA